MGLDMTHDIQRVYRKLLNCMSRPGLLENISNESHKAGMTLEMSKHLLTVLFTVLDGEVTFNLPACNDKSLIKKINHLTYAKHAAADQADYIIITKTAGKAELSEAFRQAKVGTLTDPHRSATVILEAEAITTGQQLALRGPGIEDKNYICVTDSLDWVAIRQTKNNEFPLGIDMILLDETGQIACLPRTTQIQHQGVQ